MRSGQGRTPGERRRWLGLFALAVGAGDILLVHVGFLAAFILRFGGFPEDNFAAYLAAAPGFTLMAVAIFQFYGLYDLRPQSWRNTASGLTAALAVFVIAGLGLSFVVRAFALPRTVFALAWAVNLVLIFLWRSLVWQAARRVWGRERTIIVGAPAEAADYVRRVTGGSRSGLEVTAIVAGSEAEEESPWLAEAEPPVFALSALSSLLGGRESCPDLIVVTPSTSPDDKARVITLASVTPTRVVLVPGYRDLLVLDTRMDQLGDTLVFQVGPAGIPPHQAWVKRLTDVTIAVVGLALTLPLYPFVALAIGLTSPGPVFFGQTRVGARGRHFTMWKFRTMRADAEEGTGPVVALRDDPRVTPVGRFLRRCRLDEVPQFFNVLAGSMSVVGPRPERTEFARDFVREIPFYEQRQVLKPGLTGLAQLAGRYDMPVEDKLRYDLLYAKRYSLFLDLRILLLTAKTLLLGEEAHWGDPSGPAS